MHTLYDLSRFTRRTANRPRESEIQTNGARDGVVYVLDRVYVQMLSLQLLYSVDSRLVLFYDSVRSPR